MTSARLSVRILATSDIHGTVRAYDYHRDCITEGFGLTRIATLIAEARAEAANCLLLDNGDFLQGSLLSDMHNRAEQWEDSGTHPVVAAMNAIGVRAAAIGNHEFDYGLDFLRGVLAGADFPGLSANLVTRMGATPVEDETLFAPFHMIEAACTDTDGQPHSLRIAVIGFTPPQVMGWNHAQLDGICTARHPVEAARSWVPHVRAQGADLVIALSHGGFGHHGPCGHDGANTDGGENASAALAALPGIDAVIAGHVHQVFPDAGPPPHPGADPACGTVFGTPTVMPGLWGSHLGVIDLELARDGAGWRVVSGRGTVRAVAQAPAGDAPRAGVAEDPRLTRLVAPAHARTLAFTHTRIGSTALPLHSHFAPIGIDLATRAVMDAQRAVIVAGIKGTPLADTPVLSAAAPGKGGGRGGPDNFTDIPAGPIALRDLADLYGYASTVVALMVTGAELRAWLERAAALYHEIAAGGAADDPQPLIDADTPSYIRDAIGGLRYAIALDRPPLYDRTGARVGDGPGRIVALRHAGRPVADDAQFLLACTSHRAHGGGAFPATGAHRIRLDSGMPVRDALMRHVVDGGLSDLSRAPLFTLAAPGGAHVEFLAGPGARAYLDDAPMLTDRGTDDAGFARLALRL